MNKIYTFIDESGILTKIKNPNHRYLIIANVHVANPKRVARIFKRSRLKAIRGHKDLQERLMVNKEIKGSETDEPLKTKVYSDLVRLCDNFEVGIIVLDSFKVTDNFRKSQARAFNFLLKLYFSNFYGKSKLYDDECVMHLMIDEQNIATQSKHTLGEYLNTELCLYEEKYKHDFLIEYHDSRNFLLIQLADFIANSFYRFLAYNSQEAKKNVQILRPKLVNKSYFVFPDSNLVNVCHLPS